MPRAARFFLDVGDHETGAFNRIGFHGKGGAHYVVCATGQNFGDHWTSEYRRHGAEHGENPRSDHVGADTHRLFAHPFRSCPGHRQIADINVQRIGHSGAGGQNAADVDARAHVQHRRYAQGLTDAFEAVSSRVGRLGQHQADLGAGDGVAAGGYHQHVVADQLPHQGDMPVVMFEFRVVAAHDPGNSLEPRRT